MKRIVPVFLVLVLVLPKLASQVENKTTQTVIQHQVTVTLKLIQVFVTDAKGKPALDLDKADFVLYDNGTPQKITDFESHVLAAPAAGHAGTAPVLSPSLKATTPLLSRKFIFLIDYVRNGFEGVQKAKTAALEFLDSKVGPGDEVALFTLSSGTGLTLHEYLTTDHGKFRAAFKKLREVPLSLSGGGSKAPDRELLGMELLDAQIFGSHGGHADLGRRNLFAEIAQWAKALRSIPGQKNVILFTQGFGKDVVRPGRLDSMLFETMARELASANAPVFTVDTTPAVGRPVLTEDSMAYLSRTTGGKFLGAVDYHARIATDIQDATANYYVLGYVIPAAWDGRYHNVKVEVRKPGYAVHAQRGYFNPIPFAKLSAIEKHLHLIEVALTEGPSAKRSRDFPLTAVQFAGVQETNTLLLSEIPLDVREAVGDRVEFISLILGQNKAIVDGRRVEISWGDFRTDTVYQYAAVALSPGRYDCRVVIRNLDDGRSAVGACAVDVAIPSAERPVLFPPLFLIPGPQATYVNVTSQGEGSGEAGLSISRIFPFPAKKYVPLVGALEPGTTSLFATLRCLWGKEHRGEGEMELSARLTPEGREDGKPIEMNLLDSASYGVTDFSLLEFELPELLPGRYRLEISAEDSATGVKTRTDGWFSVRPLL